MIAKLLLTLAAWLLAAGMALAQVNINSATRDQLDGLKGIGPAKAQAILDYRNAHGPFKSVDDLKNVKGIGAKRFEKLKGEFTVIGGPAKAAAGPAEKSAGTPQRSAKGDVTIAAKQGAPGSGKP